MQFPPIFQPAAAELLQSCAHSLCRPIHVYLGCVTDGRLSLV